MWWVALLCGSGGGDGDGEGAAGQSGCSYRQGLWHTTGPPTSCQRWLRAPRRMGELLPLTDSVCSRCTLAHTHAVRAVVFNRVPKCGSTTLEHIVRNQSLVCGYDFKRSADYVNSSVQREEQREFVGLISGLAKRGRVVYDRHIHFIDFTDFGAEQPQYINLIRDPIQMQISTYYFWHDCACRTHRPFCQAAWQPRNDSGFCLLDMDAVYAQVPPYPVVGTITRYLCGHDPVCLVADPASASARRAALERAIDNLYNRYLWVGVLERFEDSLQLLVQLLPGFFGSLNVTQASRAHVRPDSGTYSYQQPKASTLVKLAQENENDLSLYRHATQLLDCRLRRCGSQPQTGAAFGCVAAEIGSRFHGTHRGIGPLRTIGNLAANRLLDGGRTRLPSRRYGR